MYFTRRHLQRNLIMNDKSAKDRNYQSEWMPEHFEVIAMKLFDGTHHYDLNDNNCDGVVESSNYFTILFKNKKVLCLKYDDVGSFEFILKD